MLSAALENGKILHLSSNRGGVSTSLPVNLLHRLCIAHITLLRFYMLRKRGKVSSY